MTLAKLLSLHQQFAPAGTLTPNWGDGFLLAHNPLFRNIREGALAAGFDFHSEPSLGYRTLPLAQIETLLKEKSLPYQDNVTAIQDLGPSLLNSLTWDDISDQLAPNRVFHESCHAVFRGVLPPGSRSELERARLALWEESFANACELMASSFADSAAHRDFLQSNSYFFVPECRATLKQLTGPLSRAWVFSFVQLCYFHSNHLLDRLDEKEFEVTLQTAHLLAGEKPTLSSSERKVLRSLSKVCFELNPRFREVTTGFHFKKLGLKKELSDYLQPGFVEALVNDQVQMKASSQLIQQVTRGFSF